jgi:DNA (cytosine-5)-methyltransferase 1
MRHGSLFSGIGGFDLASEWIGWKNVFHCEWNPFGQKVLNYYWPNAITYHDITKTDFTIHRGSIDILTGGFPCQPYSTAGKRLGKEDERHLWPEMLRAIREIQPSFVVGENVRGLVNWNGGLVFDEVQADLEAEGYEVTPFLLPACGVNAVHRRDRIWFVAFKNSNKNGWGSKLRQSEPSEWEQWDIGSGDNERIQTYNAKTWNASDSNLYGCNECNCNNEVNTSQGRINEIGDIDKSNGNGNASDSNGIRCDNRSDNWEERYICRDEGFAEENKSEWNRRKRGTREISSNASDSDGIGLRRQGYRIGNSRFTNKKSKGDNWQNFPTVPPICDGDDGLSDRLDSITFPKWRNESIKAGGNAIVPQVVYQIFKAIDQYNQLNKQLTL